MYRSALASFLITALASLALSGAVGSTPASRSASQSPRCPNGTGPPLAGVTRIQSIELDLLRRSSFNNLDGPQVARDLVNNRRLWCGVIIDRLGDDALIKLRDLDENVWNV